jgi:CBS domain-containing protein
MTSPGAVIPDWLSVGALVERHELTPHHSTYLMADFEGRPTGVVRLNDLVAVPAAEQYGTSIRSLALLPDDLSIVQSDEPAVNLLGAMSGNPLVIVLDGDRPIGLITASELAQVAKTAGLLTQLRTR